MDGSADERAGGGGDRGRGVLSPDGHQRQAQNPARTSPAALLRAVGRLPVSSSRAWWSTAGGGGAAGPERRRRLR